MNNYSTGTKVQWVSDTGLTSSTIGTVVAYPAVDPDGRIDDEMVEVVWPDEGFDIVSVDNLTALTDRQVYAETLLAEAKARV